MAVIEELVALLGFKVEGEANLGRFSKGLDNVGNKINGLARNITKFGAVAAGAFSAVGFGMMKLAGDAAGPLDALVKSADRAGVSFEALQRLGFAAEQSGSSTQEMGSALEMMSGRLAEAARGSGRAKAVLDAYGISATTATGKVKDANVFFLELADHMQTMSEAESLDLAQKLGLSRGLLTLLRSGRDAIDAQGDIAEQAGLVFSDQNARDAEKYNDTLNLFTRSLNALKTAVGVDLLPAMTSVIEKMQGWMNANRQFIRQRIGDVIGTIVGHFETLSRMDAATLNKFAWAFGLMMFLAFPLASKLVIIAVAIEDILRHMGGGESVFGNFVKWLRETLGVSESTAEGIAGVAAAVVAIGVLKPAVIFAPLLAGLGAIGWAAGVTLAALTGLHVLAKTMAEGDFTPDTPIADIAQIEKAKEWADKLRASWSELKAAISENIFEPIGRSIQDWVIDPINRAIAALQSLISMIPSASFTAPQAPAGQRESRTLMERSMDGVEPARNMGGNSAVTQNNNINIEQTFNGSTTTSEQVRASTRAGALDAIRSLGTTAPSPAQ
jgi:hypothetical protein